MDAPIFVTAPASQGDIIVTASTLSILSFILISYMVIDWLTRNKIKSNPDRLKVILD